MTFGSAAHARSLEWACAAASKAMKTKEELSGVVGSIHKPEDAGDDSTMVAVSLHKQQNPTGIPVQCEEAANGHNIFEHDHSEVGERRKQDDVRVAMLLCTLGR
jgi:hypothetical protein